MQASGGIESGLVVDGISARYDGGPAILQNVALNVGPGKICLVLGPNGAGKTTLIRVVCGLVPPTAGSVKLGGRSVADLDRVEIARTIAVVTQIASPPDGFSVREIVAMGRAPHQGAWQRVSQRDDECVERALEACDLVALQHQPVTTLSGGEWQRVSMARALAQETPFLLLDEPAAHLDLRASVRLFELLKRETDRREITVLGVVHDVNLAARYADDVALLKRGELHSHGPTEEVLTEQRLSEVFEVPIETARAASGQTYFHPVGRT